MNGNPFLRGSSDQETVRYQIGEDTVTLRGATGGDLSQKQTNQYTPPHTPSPTKSNDSTHPTLTKRNHFRTHPRNKIGDTARVSPIKRWQRDDGRPLGGAGGASGGPCLSGALSVLPQDGGRPSRAAERERGGEGLSRKGTVPYGRFSTRSLLVVLPLPVSMLLFVTFSFCLRCFGFGFGFYCSIFPALVKRVRTPNVLKGGLSPSQAIPAPLVVAHFFFNYCSSLPRCLCLCLWVCLCLCCRDTKLPPQAVSELLALSDELNINEVFCVELWSQVRAQKKNPITSPPSLLVYVCSVY